MNRIKEIEARKLEIRSAIENANLEELSKFQDELTALNEEETEIRKREEIAKSLEVNPSMGNTINLTEKEKPEMTNIFETVEYRNAFFNHVVKGAEMPEEFRAATTSVTADNAAVIPTTVLDEVVRKLSKYGDILPRVRRTQFAAGVSVPTSATQFEAAWQNEDAAGTSQKMVTGSLVFAAYQLRCVAAVSFQMDVRSLAAFEAALINNIADAMGKALEKAIVSGTGVGQPTGITAATPVKKVDVTAFDYDTIIKALKAVPSAYKKDSVFIMNEGTALSIVGMTDKNGQPIGGVNMGISGQPQYRILGKEVVLTDALPAIDDATVGNTVAVLFDLSKYMLNTSYNVDLVEYRDNATRAKVYDSVALVDGKVVDANGLVFLAKK